MKFFLEKSKKGKSGFHAFWTTRFNGFDKGANGPTTYKRFFEALLEIINSLGGMVLWPTDWSYGGG